MTDRTLILAIIDGGLSRTALADRQALNAPLAARVGAV